LFHHTVNFFRTYGFAAAAQKQKIGRRIGPVDQPAYQGAMSFHIKRHDLGLLMPLGCKTNRGIFASQVQVRQT
jgi:hypothetical protein